MSVLELIQAELEQWESIRQDSIARYNRATVAIETLWQLTERMKQEAENDTHHQSNREETEIAAGD